MAAKRKKSAVLSQVVSTPEEAENAMKVIANAEIAIQQVEAAMNYRIATAKEAAETKSAPHKTEIKELTKALESYAKQNKEELFKKKKTVKTLFGVFGFRKSTKIAAVKGKKIADIRKLLFMF